MYFLKNKHIFLSDFYKDIDKQMLFLYFNLQNLKAIN